MFYSKDQILSFMRQHQTVSAPKVGHATKGPGAIDFWQLTQKNDPDLFIKREVATALPDPIIIICGPTMLKSTSSDISHCIEWLHLLIRRGFKILLWQGDQVAPESMLVCTSVTTFLECRDTLQVSDLESVNQHLRRYHCEPSHYFVFDCFAEIAVSREHYSPYYHSGDSTWPIPTKIRKTKLDLETTKNAIGELYQYGRIVIDLEEAAVNIPQFIQLFPLIQNLGVIHFISRIEDINLLILGLPSLNQLTLYAEKNSAQDLKLLVSNSIAQLNVIWEYNDFLEFDLYAFKELKKLTVILEYNIDDIQKNDLFKILNPPSSLTHFELRYHNDRHFDDEITIIPQSISESVEYLYLTLSDDLKAFRSIKFPCPKLKKIYFYYNTLEEEVNQTQFPSFLGFDEYVDAPCFSLQDQFQVRKPKLYTRGLSQQTHRFAVGDDLDHINSMIVNMPEKNLRFFYKTVDEFKSQEQQLIHLLQNKKLNSLEIHMQGDTSVLSEPMINAIADQKQLRELDLKGINASKIVIDSFPKLTSIKISARDSELIIKNTPQLISMDCSVRTINFSEMNADHLISAELNDLDDENGLILFSNHPYLYRIFIDAKNGDTLPIQLKSLPRLTYFLSNCSQVEHENCANFKLSDPDFGDDDSDEETDSNDTTARSSVFDSQSGAPCLTLDNNSSGSNQPLDGDISCVILDEKNQPVDSDYIRYKTFDHLEFNPATRAFVLSQSSFIYDTHFSFPDVAYTSKTLRCFLNITWPKDAAQAFIPIPTYKEFQDVIWANTPQQISCLYETTQQQWHLYPLAHWYGKKQTIEFTLAAKELPLKIKLQPSLLPTLSKSDSSLEFLMAISLFNTELAYLFEDSIPVYDRLMQFMEYFHLFTDKKIIPNPTNDYDHAIRRLLEKAGVCRHIAFLFNIVATILRVKVRYSENDDHSFVDWALYYDDDTYVWQSLPVSGYGNRAMTESAVAKQHRQFFETIMRLHSQPNTIMNNAATDYLSSLGIHGTESDEQIRNLLAVKNLVFTKELQLILAATRKQQLQNTPFYQNYANLFSHYLNVALISNLTPYITNPSTRSILLIMEEQQNPLVLHAEFARYFRANPNSIEHYLYIDSPADLEYLTIARSIKNGDRVAKRGPLYSALASNQAFILINWSKFSRTATLEYTSLFEFKRFRDVTINPGCQIFSVTTKPGELCDGFFKLCQLHKIESSYYSQLSARLPELPENLTADLAEEIPSDCYQDPSRLNSALFGEIRCNQGQLQLTHSPLDQAVASNKPLVIYNPPSNDEWNLLQYRHLIDGRLYQDGEFIDTRSLRLLAKKNVNEEIPHNLIIQIHRVDQPLDANGFILNSQTADLLFSVLISDENNLLTTAPGLFNTNSISILYLTDCLVLPLWLRLKELILRCQNQVTLAILPGGKLFNHQHSQVASLPTGIDNPTSKIIVARNAYTTANDLTRAFTTQTSALFKIYVNENTSYADILCDISGGLSEDGQCIVVQQTGELITKLIAGASVFLIGDLSNELYLQLQSAFCDPAHLWINGERIQFSGQLFWITEKLNSAAQYPSSRKAQVLHLATKRSRDENDDLDPTHVSFKQRRINCAENHDDVNSPAQLTIQFNSPITVLYGEPGVGKTHYLKTLEQRRDLHLYHGITELLDWLNADPNDGQQHILLLDEMNTYPIGTWDFLYGLIDGTNKIFSFLRWFANLVGKKVLGTMNPNHHPGRFTHPIIENHADFVTLKAPDREFLIQKIAFPLIKERKLANEIVTIHELARETSPEMGFSIRDLKAFCYRVLLKEGLTINQNADLQYAVPMLQEQHRIAFRLNLNELISDAPVTALSNMKLLKKVVITESRQVLLHLIRANMKLRFKDANLKSHILCEGPPSSGKSSIFSAVLEEDFGLVQDHPEPLKRYYRVNAKSNECKNSLLSAAKEGVPVILTKANYCSCPDLLSQLTDGQYNVTPGFIVLASQVPSEEQSNTTSQAIASRFHCITLNAYTEAELIQCAEQREIPAADLFVACYQDARKKSPYLISGHLFFQLTHSKVDLSGSILSQNGQNHPNLSRSFLMHF